MAMLRISKENVKDEGFALIEFLLSEFENCTDITTFGDMGDRVFIIEDPRISKECTRLEILLSENPKGSSIPTMFKEKYKGKYYAWWDDGSTSPPLFVETKTISELRKTLDLQLDEYNKHTHPVCEELVMGFIKELGERISKL